MNIGIATRTFLLLAALGAARSRSAATEFALDARLARDPAEIVTTGGRTFRGILDGIHDGRLQLRHASDGGEVVYTFAAEDIARLILPGRDLEGDATELVERQELEAAVPILEALGRHRIRYLPMLSESHRSVLWLLVQHGGARADPGTLSRVIEALRGIPRLPGQDLLLAEAGLELTLRVGTPSDAEDAAVRWCALADPAGSSALGWRVLARLAYEKGNYDQARWCALQPITFGGHVAARDIDRCYALAIAAADRLADTSHAWQLAEEMRRRQIAWPADPDLAAVGTYYQDPGADRTRPFHPREPLPSPRAGTAAPATVDAVRRLPAASTSPSH